MSIIKCKCVHAAQDKLNGEGNRVHTETQKRVGDKQVHKCTVCGTTHTKGASVAGE